MVYATTDRGALVRVQEYKDGVLKRGELWDAILKYDNLPETPYKTVNKYNLGHHEYMGSHIDEIESILRECFPEQDEKFYEYGKWGGGAMDSEAFNKLPIEERLAIEDDLRELRLYF